MSNHEDDQDEPEMDINDEHGAICRGLADQVSDFAEFISRRVGMGPAAMVTAMTVALVETVLHYSPPGQENESMKRLVLCIHEAHKNTMESAMAEALEDAAQAKARGRMQ